MKIAFLSGLYPPETKGGGEISTHLIAQGLTELGHEVTVFTEGAGGRTDTFEGVTVVRVAAGMRAKPLFEARHTLRMGQVLKPLLAGFDVVHAHDFRTALALAELNLSKPVVTVRDYAQISGDTTHVRMDGKQAQGVWQDAWQSPRVAEARWPRKWFRWWQYFYNVPFRRRMFLQLPYQIYISNQQREEIGRWQNLSEIKMSVIHNPVSSSFLQEPLHAGVDGNVLYVGRVEMYKGVGLLLEVWSEIVEQYPQAKLTIVGDGAQRIEYEDFIHAQGLQYSVTFTGHMPWSRLRTVFDETQIVVAPHVWIEPFGRTIVEAMSRGKIVVASNLGGARDVIVDDDTGILVEAGSRIALRDGLFRAMQLSPTRSRDMREAARDWVRRHLNQKVIAQEYERFYKEVVLWGEG